MAEELKNLYPEFVKELDKYIAENYKPIREDKIALCSQNFEANELHTVENLIFDDIDLYGGGNGKLANEYVADDEIHEGYEDQYPKLLKTCKKSIGRHEFSTITREKDFPWPEKGKTFLDDLMQHIIESEMTNVEIYSRAHMSRQAFSKIVSGNVVPKKSSILSLAIALKLSFKDTEKLLARAGYALMESDLGDIIVRFFIENKKYDIDFINEILYENEQKLLGNVAV